MSKLPPRNGSLSKNRIPPRGEKLGGGRTAQREAKLNEGRIEPHPRIKEKIRHHNSGKAFGMKIAEYMKWIHTKPCIVCGSNHVHAHHVKDHAILGRDDRYLIPLCPLHHNAGTFSPHGFHSDRFYAKFPKELLIEMAENYYKEFRMRNQDSEIMIADEQLRTIVQNLTEELGTEGALQWIRGGLYAPALKERAIKMITGNQEAIEGSMAENGDISDMGGY